ncbi:Hypothetical protein A7982_10586 [Minicystis rosea]|nr:Hypothetical protein A7982_10586 [Minicystis rosea]
MAWRKVLSIGFGVLSVGALVAGCGVSPQPSPPDSILEGNLITVQPDTAVGDEGMIFFHAGPGSVDPPSGIVVITNLESNEGPSFASVSADGSFDIAVPGNPGDAFRFQVKSGLARSQPFDLAVNAMGNALTEVLDEPPCLVLDPARWAALEGPGEERDLVIRNACNGTVSIAAPRLRRGLAGFSFSPASPIALAAGDTTTLTLHAENGAEREDVLFLDVTGPTASRRAITLTVPDP